MRSLLNSLFAVMAAIAMNADAAGPAMADAGKAAIGEFVAKAVERGDVPGVVTLIVNREAVLYEGAAGKQDVARGVAMPADAIFRIASMTKPVTSAPATTMAMSPSTNIGDVAFASQARHSRNCFIAPCGYSIFEMAVANSSAS